MAEKAKSNSVLAFLVGGLLVALGVLGWYAYAGEAPFAQEDEASITIELPDVDVKE